MGRVPGRWLRTNKLYRIGGYIDKRNERWAAQHGRMPLVWNDGEPWIRNAVAAREYRHGERRGECRA